MCPPLPMSAGAHGRAPIDLAVNISKMAGDSDLVTMELLEKTCTWES